MNAVLAPHSGEATLIVALWGFILIAFAILSEFRGVTAVFRADGAIYRNQDPVGFRKAVGANIVIGLLFILGWIAYRYWHIF
jgi:hypothetical protein